MPSKHELEQILHREKMNEPSPEYGFERTGEEFTEDINQLIDKHVPYSEDLKSHKWIKYKPLGITEYKEKYISPQLELERLDFNKAQLIKAQRSILFGALYIYIVVMLLMYISIS